VSGQGARLVRGCKRERFCHSDFPLSLPLQGHVLASGKRRRERLERGSGKGGMVMEKDKTSCIKI
jgi:hypothetical protein